MLFTITQQPGWEYAIEPRVLTSEDEERAVTASGGLIFEEHRDAEDFCEKVSYRTVDIDGEDWLIPGFLGHFSETRIGGLHIYVPVREAVG